MSTLMDALAFVLAWEGGYINDPVDRGGATNFGITQRTYDAWLASKHLPSADVQYMDHDVAIDIYTARYWRALDGEHVAALCPNLAIVCLDSAVQHGPRWAAVTLQRTVGATVDGEIGPATLMALKLALVQGGPIPLLTGYLERRKAYYQSIVARNPDQERFRRGWQRRFCALAELVGVNCSWKAV